MIIERSLNLALGIYLASVMAYAASYLSSQTLLRRTGLGLLVLGWLSQTVFIAWRWQAAGRPPLSNQYESLIALTWSLAALYFAFRLTKGIPVTGLGFWVGLFAIAGLGAASLMNRAIAPLVPALRSNWLLIHVTITLLGYASLTLSAIAGGVYLVCRHKNNGQNKVVLLDGFIYRSMALGVLFLGLGIMAGAVWANVAWGSYWSWDPKETWSLITWLVYLVILHLYKGRQWRGADLAAAALIGFAFVLFTYFGVNYLLRGMHSYA